MKIKITRSGGVAGIPITWEVDEKNLPPLFLTKVKKIITEKNLSTLPLRAKPNGAADYYTYQIFINEGENETMMECNEFSLQDDLKSLIKYIEAYSKKNTEEIEIIDKFYHLCDFAIINKSSLF